MLFQDNWTSTRQHQNMKHKVVNVESFALLWEVLNYTKQKADSELGKEWTVPSQGLASLVQSIWCQGKLPYWWMLYRPDKEQAADQAGGCSNLNKSSWLTPPAGNIQCTSPGPGCMFVRPMNMPQFHLDHLLSRQVLWVQTAGDLPELTWTNKL
jgi:hypothetical protein